MKLISICVIQIMVTGLHAFKNLLPTYPLFVFVIIFGNSCPIMSLFLGHSSTSFLSMMQISGPLITVLCPATDFHNGISSDLLFLVLRPCPAMDNQPTLNGNRFIVLLCASSFKPPTQSFLQCFLRGVRDLLLPHYLNLGNNASP